MPEYLYPGVYVEESDAAGKPLPGVDTAIDDAMFRSLAAELGRVAVARIPGWTEATDADPGVSLIELFAWLAEGLILRANAIPGRGRTAATRAVAALSALADPCLEEGAILRPLFFSGGGLEASQLRAEVDYQRAKLRRHNRTMHGFGIVTGLGVRVESSDADGTRVVVEPGYAIDRRGEELALDRGATLRLSVEGDEAYVNLRFWEHAGSKVASTASGQPCCAYVEEACVVGVNRAVPAFALAVARLIRHRDDWVVDAAFAPPRAGVMRV